MEILFLILAFVAGLLIGAAAMFLFVRWAQRRMARQMSEMFTVQTGDDPFAQLQSVLEALQTKPTE